MIVSQVKTVSLALLLLAVYIIYKWLESNSASDSTDRERTCITVLNLERKILENKPPNANCCLREDQKAYCDDFLSPTVALQMKKIGLEIPESTRKDMEHDDQDNQDKHKPPVNDRRRRRILACALGEYNDTTTSTCLLCTDRDPLCTRCTMISCTKCSNSFQMSGTGCICPTATAYVIQADICKPCATGCRTCSNNLTTYCTSCYTGPPGYYYVSANNTCPNCKTNCDTCDSATSCSKCINDYYLVGSGSKSCNKCPAGTCSQGTVCYTATSPCTKCTVLATQCTACVPGRIIIPNYYKCYLDCVAGQYYDEYNDICVACPVGCAACIGYSGVVKCTQCLEGFAQNAFDCNIYPAAEPNMYRTTNGPIAATNWTANLWPLRNTGAPEGPGRYTINPTTLAYMPCAAPMSTCIRGSNGPIPTICTPDTALFNNSCVAKFASGFVNSTSMQVVASPDPKVLFYDSTGVVDCAFGYYKYSSSACVESCPAGYNLISDTCQLNSTLKGCLSIDKLTGACSSCEDFYYLANGICQPCYSSCRTCSDGTSACLTCVAGYQKRQDGLCYPSCPSLYTLNSTNQFCVLGTVTNCRTYNEDGQCSSCDVGFFLTQANSCAVVCSSAQFYDTTTSNCVPCAVGCLSCLNSTTCLACEQRRAMNGGICGAPPACTQGCEQCTSSSLRGCYKPLPSYYLNYSNEVVKYTPYCDYGKYYDSTLSICKPCNSSCESCTGPTYRDCIVCNENHMRYGKSCYAIGSSGCFIYMGNFLDTSFACLPCTKSECLYCPEQVCEVCKAGFRPVNGDCVPCTGSLTLYCHQVTGNPIGCKGGSKMMNGICVPICFGGNYRQTGLSTCTDCSSSCETCAYGTGQHTTCMPGEIIYFSSATYWGCTNNQDVSFQSYYLTSSNTTTRCQKPMKKCLNSSVALACIQGYYLDTQSCEKCDARCLTCSGAASNCTSCHMGYTYDGALGTCTAVCERYEYLDTASLECIPCSRNCRTCHPTISSGSYCLSCFDGFYMPVNSTFCIPCHESCETCTGKRKEDCVTCLPHFGTMNSNGTCSKSCAVGTYLDWTDNTCKMCHKFCEQCLGPSLFNCTECAQKFDYVPNAVTDYPLLGSGMCRRTCPPGTFLEFQQINECKPCHQSCLTCSGPREDNCLSCATRRRQVGTRCEACHPFCKLCSGPGPNECVECEDSLTPYSPTNYCLSSCPFQHAFDPIQRVCVVCDASCGLCLNTLSTGCLTCSNSSNFMVTDGRCLESCGANEIYFAEQRACASCHADCGSCFGREQTQCASCKLPGYFIQTSKICGLGCDENSYQLNASHCADCHKSCRSCSSSVSTGCTSCFQDFFLLPNSSCDERCPPAYYEDKSTWTCKPCGGACMNCSAPADAYQCTSCYPERDLRSDAFCAKPCSKGLYFYDPGDDCYLCHPNCATCISGTSFDCLTCAPGVYLSYTGECVHVCPTDSAPTPWRCKKCHQTCLSCKDDGPYGCLTCADPLYLTVSGACAAECDPHEISLHDHICEACHPSCDTCWNTAVTGCTTCLKPEVSTLSESGVCIDCLLYPETDRTTCWYSVPLALTKISARSQSVKASTSVRLTFAQQGSFSSRLTAQLLKSVLTVEVLNVDSNKWTWEVRLEGGDILIDLFFAESKSWPTIVSVKPAEQIVLKNSRNGVAELIFWKTPATLEIEVRKAPDAAIISALEAVTATQSGVSSAADIMSIMMTTMVVFSASPAGAMLLKLLQVFKLLSRLRLLNVFFGSYLEMCLRVVASLYPLGGDNISNPGVRANPSSRGKLDLYRVSVLSADVMGWQYMIYFTIFAVRLYRNKVRYYASNTRVLSLFDSFADAVAERTRTLILAMVGIDIVFYSLRCLSHMDNHSAEGFISKTSFVLSFFTVTFMTLDLIMLLRDNSQTTFARVRSTERVKRVVISRDQNKKDTAVDTDRSLRVKNKVKILKVEAKPNGKAQNQVELSQTTDLKEMHSTKTALLEESSPSSSEPINRKLKTYLYGYRQQKRVIDNPSAEQFFGNGIKLHKLRTPEGRYYNTVAMLKLIILEPIFINFQLFPTVQMLLILGIQAAFLHWIIRAGFKVKVFDSKLSFISSLANETAILIFLLAGTLFVVRGGVYKFSDGASNALQVGAIVAIAVAALIGIVEFVSKMVGIVVSTYKNRKLSMLLNARKMRIQEQGLVRHRVIGRDLPGAEPPVPPVDADMSSSVADIKANQVGQSAKPVLGKTRLAPGKRLSRPPLQPLARK